jgi:hypothetical protein
MRSTTALSKAAVVDWARLPLCGAEVPVAADGVFRVFSRASTWRESESVVAACDEATDEANATSATRVASPPRMS